MPNSNSAKTKAAPVAPDTGVAVRMFCQGLGDCFLITIPQKGPRPYSIMIDCGLAMNTPKQEQIMSKVVQSIAALTSGVVDLLVVTHEHWDHVSGFVQAADDLKPEKLKFLHLWWGWTENPDDDLAKQLKLKYHKAKKVVARARELVAHFGADRSSQTQLAALDSVLAFHGLGVGKDEGIEKAMAAPAALAKAAGGDSAVECLLPGKQLKLPGKALSGLAAGVRVYVLGPPYQAARIADDLPSKAHPETYEKARTLQAASDGLGVNWSWMAAVMDTGRGATGLEADTEDDDNVERSNPFDAKVQVDWNGAEKHPYFAARYFAQTPENQGRRIDGDWLWTGAQKLALQLDSKTNNTSLVLAFELPVSKKVLLFTGDAQVGNWLSWHDQDYPADDGRKVTATDLLNRTVLYKVGHHGSHNATLRQKGLELMTHPDLVAMLPVEADAVKRLGYGEMPLPSLVEALKERTHDRILRVDEPWAASAAPGQWRSKLVAASIPAETLGVMTGGKPATRPLYMQYVIRDIDTG